VEAGSTCKGADGRSANLRSRAARQFYNKGSDALKRDLGKIWNLSPSEKKDFALRREALRKHCGRGAPKAEYHDKRRAAVIVARRTERSLWISRHLRMARKARVVEEGVEPNRGPSTSTLSLLTLNVDGEAHFWSFMRYLETVTCKPDLVALQELSFKKDNIGRAAARAHFLGFRLIFNPDRPSSDGRFRGTGWLVKKPCSSRFGELWSSFWFCYASATTRDDFGFILAQPW
jgi:hypothetical protein